MLNQVVEFVYNGKARRVLVEKEGVVKGSDEQFITGLDSDNVYKSFRVNKMTSVVIVG